MWIHRVSFCFSVDSVDSKGERRRRAASMRSGKACLGGEDSCQVHAEDAREDFDLLIGHHELILTDPPFYSS